MKITSYSVSDLADIEAFELLFDEEELYNLCSDFMAKYQSFKQSNPNYTFPQLKQLYESVFKPYNFELRFDKNSPNNHVAVDMVHPDDVVLILNDIHHFDKFPTGERLFRAQRWALAHELTHVQDYRKDPSQFKDYDSRQNKTYLSHPSEIKAHARGAVEDARGHGWTNEEILQALDDPNYRIQIGDSRYFLTSDSHAFLEYSTSVDFDITQEVFDQFVSEMRRYISHTPNSRIIGSHSSSREFV